MSKLTTTRRNIITPKARDLAEAIAGGHVTGMFSSQYDSPRWSAVPAIEGTRVGQFERSDVHRYYSLVTDEVVALIAAGYAAAERVGDFYSHVDAMQHQFVALGLDSTSKRCDVRVVLTAAGREALGLAPAATDTTADTADVTETPDSVPAEVVPAAGQDTAADTKPAAKRARKPRKPSASARAIAAVLSSNPVCATSVHAEEIGFRKSTVTVTLRRMVAAGELVATTDFDGTPMYYLAGGVRERYALAA